LRFAAKLEERNDHEIKKKKHKQNLIKASNPQVFTKTRKSTKKQSLIRRKNAKSATLKLAIPRSVITVDLQAPRKKAATAKHTFFELISYRTAKAKISILTKLILLFICGDYHTYHNMLWSSS